MATRKKKPAKRDLKTRVKLTETQREQLAKIFGEEMVSRIKHIELEQISGFLKAQAMVN